MKNLVKPFLLFTIAVSFSFFSKAQVSGLVFRDYNGNGTRQNAAGYIEPGAGGVIIRAYNSSDALIATQTSSSATATLGQYTFPTSGLNSIANGTTVRLEFIVPSSGTCIVNSTYDFSSGSGGTYGTAVRFVTSGASAININYAINNPADFLTGANPSASATMFTALQFTGDPSGGGTSGTSVAFYKFPYTNEASTSPTGTPPLNATDLATNAQIGTCYGVAYSKYASKVFTSAFMKRHAGFGPANGTFNNAPGAIYIINPSLTSSTGAASYFTSLDALGFPTHNSTGIPAYGAGTSYNIAGTGVGAVITYTANGLGVIGTNNANRGLPANKTTRHRDPAAFDQVGKVSLGDMDISDDGQYLFVTNLYDRKIYQIQLNNVANPTSATVVGSWSLPNPPLRSTSGLTNAAGTYTGANDGTNFYDGTRGLQRPFALKYYRGKVYIGAVTTGEGTGAISTQDNNTGNPEYTDLWSYVWEFNPATATFTAAPILQAPLNFNRGTNADAQSETWRPWTNTFPTPWSAGNPRYTQFQQPMFTDIEFDTDGTMILGFRDRFGDQSAFDEETMNNNTRIAGQAMGDLYRAYFNTTSCVFEIEQNAKEGPGSPKAATAGANNGNGPSNYTTNGGEFYFRDGVYNGNTSTLVGTFHLNCTQGALAILKGTDTVATTTMDPIRAWSGGISWFSNTTGDNGRDYEMIAGTGAGTFPTNAIGDIGKANGLGDLELLQDAAPIEIGNRVWNDANGDGIQNPGEASLPNVTLELFLDANNDGVPDGAAIGMVTTDATGNYYFTSAAGADVTGIDYGVAITSNQNYIIRVASSDWNSATGAGIGDLAGLGITRADKIGYGAIDLSDNDAVLTTGTTVVPQVRVTTGLNGQNNHNIDFGFKALASIGDKVWRDDNKDGIQTAGEPGVAGITVTLYQNGVVIGTTVTDAYGIYLFDNLTPSSSAATEYSVGFTLPANYIFTTQTNTQVTGTSDVTNTTTVTGGSTAANGSDANTTTGQTGSFWLTAGEIERGADAGLIFSQPTTNSIGDKVWFDNGTGGGTASNGIQDGTEPGVSGVTVTLYDATGSTVIATTITDANGNYIFTGLPANTTYVVGITPPVGMLLTTATATSTGNGTTNSDFSTTTFKTTSFSSGVAGTQITGIDAGLIQQAAALASLGDRVWNDLNNNGIQNAGEFGVPGVTVDLYLDANGNGVIDAGAESTPSKQTVTDAFGNYIFNGLNPGAYAVGFGLPSGYIRSTFTNAGADDFKDNDANASGVTALYYLTAGQRNMSVDAAIVSTSPNTAQVGNFVWFDTNSNGTQDAGEPGVGGVTVTIYNNAGTAIGTTTSDANGNYQFTNLAAGNYSIGFSNIPAGYSLTSSTGTTSASNTTNSDASQSTGRTTQFALAAAQSLHGLDAGLIAGVSSGLGSIGNKIWWDLDGNNLQDTGEPGVSGVTVTLLDYGPDGAAGGGDDGAARTTITNALGEYIFTGLPAGNYAVQFGTGSTLPAGAVAVTQNSGTNDAIDSDGAAISGGISITAVYNLNAGEDNLTVDLGIRNTAKGSFGDRIWYDNGAGGGTPNDGIQNGAEIGVAGVMVTLVNAAGQTVDRTGTVTTTPIVTTTDANGYYAFADLTAGVSFAAKFSNLPAGFDFTSKAGTGSGDDSRSDADIVSGLTPTVTIVANTHSTALDGGIVSARAALGNYVWLDTNGDGIQDGTEAGVPGVTVTLYRPGFGLDGIAGNGDDALPVASMITDQTGGYLFTNLDAGTYQVEFNTIPGGLLFTKQNTPGDNGDNTNSDAVSVTGNPSVGRTGNIVLSAGEVDLTVDAGLFKPRAVIGNYVWADTNNNGIQEGTEPPASGILVTLIDGGGNQ